MSNKPVIIIIFLCLLSVAEAQTHEAIEQFVNCKDMEGASFSMMVKEVDSGAIIYSYDAGRKVIPASVLKLVTTASAIELLGPGYRFETVLEYEGLIADSVLAGNLYIRGSGDPSLGSSHFAADRNSYTPAQNTFIPQWIAALKEKGIKQIKGSVISDESIFDTEGVSMKWLQEDIGVSYGAGSYGLSVFDNLYKLYFSTGVKGSRPELVSVVPDIKSLRFHNYLVSAPVVNDSAYITGAPFSGERYLYGVLPAERKRIMIRGAIPDPPLFLAQYFRDRLQDSGIVVEGEARTYRLLQEENKISEAERKAIAVTYSPTLREIVRVTNERSHNLYADALLKTLGAKYGSKYDETLSTSGKGIRIVSSYWQEKGLDVSSLWMFDGNGLSVSNKVTATFICELLTYMATKSSQSEAFITSLPKAGMEGTVSGILKGAPLQGKALLKSGGMSRVRAYGGYITKGDKRYALALFANNYTCSMQEITKEIEALLAALFK
ncbi:MAG: D-alanyl-D-alanine carboxypeptidase/D-alanyl-D-alanine-endopeptidase [Tannerellaceae bacterium]|jgi:D-alanyl-D-alanine carboxypeptidase/D-alanyl-D-alanine-endopeptidase (penicillin-binding protein 4)|nr:D-alanyl-D-alanine carboxypeptidase/D-alanyl-D-alanine-endopeptidase [Tannerellaceae bacterium]